MRDVYDYEFPPLAHPASFPDNDRYENDPYFTEDETWVNSSQLVCAMCGEFGFKQCNGCCQLFFCKSHYKEHISDLLGRAEAAKERMKAVKKDAA